MEKISEEDKALELYENNKEKAQMASLINEHGLMVAEMLQEISGTLPPRPKMPLTTKINHFFNGRRIARQDEMDRMERSIITRQKASVGYVAGYSDIKFTVGVAETEAFDLQQRDSKRHEEPYYERVERNIGRDYPVHIWMMPSVDPSDLISGTVSLKPVLIIIIIFIFTPLPLTPVLRPGHPLICPYF